MNAKKRKWIKNVGVLSPLYNAIIFASYKNMGKGGQTSNVQQQHTKVKQKSRKIGNGENLHCYSTFKR